MSDVLKHAGPNSISMLYQNPAHSLSTLNSAHSYALHTRPHPGPSCFQQPQLHQRLDPTRPPPTTSFLQPSLTHKTGLSSGPPSPSLPSASTGSALHRVAPPRQPSPPLPGWCPASHRPHLPQWFAPYSKHPLLFHLDNVPFRCSLLQQDFREEVRFPAPSFRPLSTDSRETSLPTVLLRCLCPSHQPLPYPKSRGRVSVFMLPDPPQWTGPSSVPTGPSPSCLVGSSSSLHPLHTSGSRARCPVLSPCPPAHLSSWVSSQSNKPACSWSPAVLTRMLDTHTNCITASH